MKIPHEPLTSQQMEVLRLVNRTGGDAKGWALCSDVVWPLTKQVPKELLERQTSIWGGMVRLTDAGKAVVKYTP